MKIKWLSFVLGLCLTLILGCEKLNRATTDLNANGNRPRGIDNGIAAEGDDIGVGSMLRITTSGTDVVSQSCTASEIAPRCLLTAAHCNSPAGDGYTKIYTKVADITNGWKRVIAIDEKWPHPQYAQDRESIGSNWAHDLMVMWTSAYETEGWVEPVDRAERGKLATWKILPVDTEKQYPGVWFGMLGYGPRTQGGPLGVRNYGVAYYHQEQSGLALSDALYYNMGLPGDSGGPVLKLDSQGKYTHIVGVMANTSPDADYHRVGQRYTYSPSLSRPENKNFISLSTNRPPQEMLGTAADLCRPRLGLEVRVEGENGVRRVLGAASDPLGIHADARISCKKSEGPCVATTYKRVVLDADPSDASYRFVGWESPPTKEGVCPPSCGSAPHCEYNALDYSPKHEYYGIVCIAKYEAIPFTEPMTEPSDTAKKRIRKK